ncbi:vanomycin resistance protein VanB [Asanoa ishikariensis]|uniref:Vancomycin resistance protein YoaR, contains peptidoglycan-binding and VanW domains n=1 Tax=Asanoa ishikariensis TaxID=137265 RepID=A0A1H3QXL4_9ACTN|nr:VanW family protein [Asanoa ishikariensis]GIF64633.1 vanomycin resistance protein VanB [Asanoa ishikariensis]SDZ17785.1 Vancomycin resistance protein YoaR, contains peptidoglycan-binding and VanW domains [Asanoa ishikariensis]
MQTALWSNKRRRRYAVGGAILALLLVLIGVLAGFTNRGEKGDFARGTSVLGIDIGGLDRSDAAARLHSGLDGKPELDKPITVHITGDSAKTADALVTPDQVGLAVDIDATVAAAAAHGGDPVTPQVTLDSTKLDDVLRPTVAQVTSDAATPGSVTFDGVTPKVTYPSPGKAVDLPKATDAVKTGWIDAISAAGVTTGGTVPSPGQTGAPAVSVPLVEVDNGKARAAVDQLMDTLVKPAVAAPVTVHSAKGDVTITPDMIAKSLKIDGAADGTVTPSVDAGALRTAMGPAISKIESSPPSAVKGEGATQQVLVSAAGGQYVDGGKLATDVLGVLPQTGARSVNATLNPAPAQVADANLQKLGVKEKVSSFTTKFTGGLTEPRVKNIVTVAKKVDGAVVKPGETFSLNGFTGWRGYEQGYVDAPVIVDNKLVPAVGGGISQFTTTMFNASYYAGLKDVEHKPHSFYISRYPSVIESTIYWPNLDLKFQNNTPYGMLIDTSYTKDSVTVSMWSTKVYDSVKTEWAPKHDVTKPENKTLPAGPDCIATTGTDGFTQDAYRIITKGGKEVQREKFSWRYDAEPRYVCEKPTDDKPASDQATPDQATTESPDNQLEQQPSDVPVAPVTPPVTSGGGWGR